MSAKPFHLEKESRTAHPTDAAVPMGCFLGATQWAVRALLLVVAVAGVMPLGVAADPPRVVRPLDDVTLTVGTGPHIVDLRGVYWGAPEKCESVSSDESVVTVSIEEGYDLTLTPVGVGTATITITASNEHGSADHSFMVTVNHVAPVAVGELPELNLRVGDVSPVELADAFSGEALTYTLSSSSESTASVSVADSTASITALAAGMATITVTATNTGGSAEQSFAATVRDEAPAAVGELSDVTVTVGGDPAEVEVAPAFTGSALVFTALSSSGDVAGVSVAGGTLTVTALAAGTATVTVTATNSEGSAEQSFAATVRDEAPGAVGELSDVTVTVGGDPAEVEVAPAFTGSALVFTALSSSGDVAGVSVAGGTLTVTALAAGTATVTVTATNSEGSAEQSFAATVRDEAPGAVGELSDVTVTVGGDPAEVEVAPAFTGSALVFTALSSSGDVAGVSVAGGTLTVTALAAGTATVTVTATNSEGSAEQSFVATVRDVPPAAAGSLPDVALIVGGEAALVDATDSFAGTALVYSVAASGDAVSVAVVGSQVTVVPLVEGAATITVTATNSEGAASLGFNATVSTDVAETDALENAVAAIARNTLASVNSAVGARFRAERVGTPAPEAAGFTPWHANQFGALGQCGGHSGGALPTGFNHNTGFCASQPGAGPFRFAPSPMTGGLHGLQGMNFAIPLNASASGEAGQWTAPAQWTFWGQVDRQSFEGAGYDGSLTSLYVGADASFGENWLAGIAVSRSSGDADYEFTSTRASGTGDLDTDLVSVHPYMHWTVDDVAELWAIVGAGWGDVDLVRSATAQEGEADLSMWMLSAGGRRTLAAGAEWDFALTGDAGVLEMRTDDGVGIIDDMNVSVGRVKFGLEGARVIVMDGGDTFSVFGQVGGRHDSGDGDTGTGVELTGGVRYDTAGRIRIEAKARLLSLHSAEDYEENGVSLSAIVRPRSDGGGMSLALSSYLGVGMSANNRPLEQGYGYPGRWEEFGAERDAWGMDARLGYGLRVQRLSGLLTPFAKFDMTGENSRGMRMGIRYDQANTGLAEWLNLELSGGQVYDRFRDEAHNLIEVRGELRF